MIIKLNDIYNISCKQVCYRLGFTHVAVIYKGGKAVFEGRVGYLNKTWECYKFQTVLLKVIKQYFTGLEKEEFLTQCKTGGIHAQNSL